MKKRVLSALLALCLTLSLAGAAFAENETPVTTASPAPVEQTLDENATEPTEPAVSDADSNDSVSSDETQDDAVAGSDSSDSNSAGTSSDEVDGVTSDTTDASDENNDISAGDSTIDEDSTAESNNDSTLAEDENGNLSDDADNAVESDVTNEESNATAADQGNAPSAANEAEDGSAEPQPFAETRKSGDEFAIEWTNDDNHSRSATVELWVEGTNKRVTTNVSDVPLNSGDEWTISDDLKTITSGNDTYTYRRAIYGYYGGYFGWWNEERDFTSIVSSYSKHNNWTTKVNGRTWSHDADPVIRIYYTKEEKLGVIDTVDSISAGIHINLYDYEKNTVSKDDGQQGKWGIFGNFDFGGNDRDQSYVWNKYDSGESDGARQGIMKKQLTGTEFPNQYPEFNTDWRDNGQSLSHGASEEAQWLFTGDGNGKTAYTELNNLFSYDEETETYSYDSSEHFASITAAYGENSGNDKDFVVYDKSYSASGDQKNFMPFNDLNANGTLKDTEDYLFGMEVYFQFNQPQNGKVNGKDMIFEFNGDDDVWVYIDNVLVLDIGGIHGAVGGRINFAQGTVTVDKVKSDTGYGGISVRSETVDLKKFFVDALGQEAADQIEWVTLPNGNHTFADYSNHNFKFFYLERGEGGSNCELSFNLPTIPSGTVSVNKQVNSSASDEQKNAIYNMQLLVKDDSGNFVTPAQAIAGYAENPFTIDDSLSGTTGADTLSGDGNFTVQGNHSKYIHNIPAGTVYKIQELEVAEGTTVSINNVAATISGTTASTDKAYTVGQNNSVTISNKFAAAPPKDVSITTAKSAVRDSADSDDYTLNLSVSGERSEVGGDTQKLDVLFILDNSNSMINNKDVPTGEYSHGHEVKITRLEAANRAIRRLIWGEDGSTGLSNNTALDVQYALVTFSGNTGNGTYDDAENALSTKYWTDNPNDITGTNYDGTWFGGALPIDTTGGTNYQAGFYTAKEILNSNQKRVDAETVVIFISDGMPGYYYSNGEDYYYDWYEAGRTIGVGSPTSYNPNGEAIKRAISQCAELDMDYFYTIGVADATSLDALDDLVESGAPNLVDGSTKDSYMATDMKGLQDVFDRIQQQLTFFAAQNVVMHDVLSDYAEVPEPSNVEFTVKLEQRNEDGKWTSIQTEQVTGKDGNTYARFDTVSYNEEGDQVTDQVYIIPVYDNTDKSITVKLAANESGTDMTYQLAPGYRYTVSLTIRPTSKAYTDGPDKYNGTGEAETGTHATEAGFWSNDNDKAKVTYHVTANTPELSKAFPKPVIQVNTADLTITKQIVVDGDRNADLSVFNNHSFTFTVKGNDATNSTVEKTATITWNAEGENTVKVENLPMGDYTITETDPTSAPEGYTYTGNGNPVSATVSSSGGSATVTNHYKHDDVTLTVTKTVGGNMGDTSPENKFDFKLTLTKGGSPYSLTSEEAEKQGLTVVNNSGEAVYYTFQLASGENKAITLSYGVTAKVEETDRPDYKELSRKYLTEAESSERGTYVEVNYQEQLLNGDYTFDFQNTRDIITPTGLEDNHTKPFGLMVGVAVMAGMALVGGAVVRRRRRWME
jgi:fibro-slime domain-containing protein